MKDIAEFFKIASEPIRIRIMCLLSQRDLCVCQLCGILEESQPKVSKHLAKMRDLGIVSDQRKDKYVYYSIKDGDTFAREVILKVIERGDPTISSDLAKIGDVEKFLDNATKIIREESKW